MNHVKAVTAEGCQKEGFDWKSLMQHLLQKGDERIRIGPAWPLFFDICLNADRGGVFVSTYSKIAHQYGVAIITVKMWRKHLFDHGVIKSFSHGQSVAFQLLEPYASYILFRFTEHRTNERAKESDILKKLLLRAMQSEDSGASD